MGIEQCNANRFCAEDLIRMRAREGVSLDKVLDEVLPAFPNFTIEAIRNVYQAEAVKLKQLEKKKPPVVSNPLLAPAAGPKAPAPARIGGSAKLWRLTRNAVNDTMAKYNQDIKTAYNTELKLNPKVAGRITFNVTVGNDGKVVSIELKDGRTPINDEAIKNIEKVFKEKVRFPEFSDRSVEQIIEIPLLLSPS